MPVAEVIRKVETEIDNAIRNLPIWRTPRDQLLRVLLDYYRDAIEVIFMVISWASMSEKESPGELPYHARYLGVA
jgi:hypothetical protein